MRTGGNLVEGWRTGGRQDVECSQVDVNPDQVPVDLRGDVQLLAQERIELLLGHLEGRQLLGLAEGIPSEASLVSHGY